jgi:two-component system KDP operon response regulator KdpE
MPKVLVIDDEAQIRRFLRAGFELHGFTVVEAENAAAGLKAATMGAADLIILDLNLPDLEGSEVLERIRSWSNIPVIVLSIHSDEHEKVRLLRMGADDYVVKPFGIAELLARSDAALRRHLRGTNREPVVRVGPLSIDLVSRVVTLKGKRIQLTRKEYGAHAGNIQYLRILVRKLRQKIEADLTQPLLIVSESGVGYRLDQSEPGAAHRPGDISSDKCCA